ncbi:uncharacterized protein LOC141641875 [Silene latifolia]|uniref:uncharacterized protein LOC141641875 n=1 Tax=Silene latifolia TaxID=37657 RepID=UPI003D7841B5
MNPNRRAGKEVMGCDSGDAGGIFEWEPGEGREQQKHNLTLVGKLWTAKGVNAKAVIDTMTKIWSPTKPIIGNIVDAKEKLFVFKFPDIREKEKVLEGQPWHFDKAAWCFNEPNENGKMTDVPLFHLPIWVRIYDLPISGRSNESNIQRLCGQLGTFVAKGEDEGDGVDRAIRIRVLHDVRQAVKASVGIKMRGGEVVRFDVKYERLPNFCYGCGLMGHGERDCDEGPYEEHELQFGDWLRASPRKIMKVAGSVPLKAARDLSSIFDAEKRKK